ncbi:unnamed protein product [Urochloa decumbens]|uniref:Serine acetyltransferase N-terminal domain-containing protein n=1 Tax=Urochloa decumbens TaxID=240449 RepID=A0ABC8YWI8_9POAL
MTAGQPLHADTSHHHPHQRPSRHHSAASSNPPRAALDAAVVPSYPPPESDGDESWVWSQIKAEARRDADAEPALASFLYATVLSHPSLARSLAFHLANKLCSSTLLYDLFVATLAAHPSLRAAAVADLVAARSRDPACAGFASCLLNYKGFLALQAHRVAHVLWAAPAPQDRGWGSHRRRRDYTWECEDRGRGQGRRRVGGAHRRAAVGSPARLIRGKKGEDDVVMIMPGESMDHTSFIQQWSDYII